MKPKGRFIAGVVCPRCSQMDRIVTYVENKKPVRECIHCGFKNSLSDLPSINTELSTRVNQSSDTFQQNQSASSKPDYEAKVIRFISPDDDKN